MLDMKLHVAAADNFFYPDLMVTCSEADRADALVKREPKLIVEVPSPSTAARSSRSTACCRPSRNTR
jgi:Uma2 family endonuclease